MKDKRIVFAYGSLMRGFSGFDEYMVNADFLGDATLKGDLRFLYSDYPAVIHKPIDGKPVKGELFSVGEETLQALRKYEGVNCPFTCYAEREVTVQTSEGDVKALAFIVAPILKFPVKFFSREIAHRDWRRFVDEGMRLPIPKPVMLALGFGIVGAVAYEVMNLFMHA